MIAEFCVVIERGNSVFKAAFEQLKGTELSDHIVDVVEGAFIDVHLLLPQASIF